MIIHGNDCRGEIIDGVCIKCNLVIEFSTNELQGWKLRFIANNFILSNQEQIDLLKYFSDQGYISHEFHQPIHDLIKRLRSVNK